VSGRDLSLLENASAFGAVARRLRTQAGARSVSAPTPAHALGARHVVALGVARESEQRRHRTHGRARIEGCGTGRRTGSGGAREFPSRARSPAAPVPRRARRRRGRLHQGHVILLVDLREIAASEADAPRAFGVARVGEDDDAVGVRERAVSLLVGIAAEAAGALVTLEHSVAVGADRGVGRDRSGEPADRFAADVAWCGAREQMDADVEEAEGHLAHPALRLGGARRAHEMYGAPLNPAEWAAVTLSTLVMAGAESPALLQHGSRALAEVLPNAERRMLAGVSHNVKMRALAPVLAEFIAGDTDVADPGKVGTPTT
jgi:hypothetical protein